MNKPILNQRPRLINLLDKVGYDLDHIAPDKFIDNVQQCFSEYKTALSKARKSEENFAQHLNRTVLKDKLQLIITLEENTHSVRQDISGLLESNLPSNLPNCTREHIIGIANQIFAKQGLHEGLVNLFKCSENQLVREYLIEPFIPSKRGSAENNV